MRIRFTGARTGHDALAVPGHGIVRKGDVIDVSDDIAKRWTQLLPDGSQGTVEGLEERWSLAELKIIARDHGLDEHGHKADLAGRIFEHDPKIAPSGASSDFELAGPEGNKDAVRSPKGEHEEGET